MAQARIPEDEQERLQALHAYDLLDRNVDKVFDTLIRTAADICDVDISVIALIDSDRQYFLARNGMKPRETPREIAFCAHAILEPFETFEIPDATKDPRFADNPLVTGEIGVRFYAAQPLTTPEGHAIGGLCLIGKKPKSLNDLQRQTLRHLSTVIMALLDSRKKAIATGKSLEQAKVAAELANNTIQAQNARFSVALAHITQGLAVYDGQQRLVLCNSRYASVYGFPRELVKPGTTLRQVLEHRIKCGLYTGPNPEAYIRERLDWARGGTKRSAVNQLTDGRWIAHEFQPLPGGGWVSTHEDVTERKRAEEAQQESERHFRNLIEGSIQGLFIARDWRLLFANQSVAEIFGYKSAAEVIGLEQVGQLLAPSERKRIFGYKTAREAGEYAPEVFESRGLRKDGSIIDIEFRVRLVDWHGTSAIQCVILDITDRKKAEAALLHQHEELRQRDAALRTQNERFNTALDNMSQGLCMFDADQRVIVCNERYLSLYRLTAEQVKPGVTLRQIIEYRIANGFFAGAAPENYIAERLDWVKSGVRESKVQELSDGRAIAITHQPMPGGGWVTTHEDVTETRRAEALNRRLARIVDDAINEVFVFDAETLKFLQVNASACRNSGYTAEELAELTPVDLKPEFTLEKFEESIAPLRRGEKNHIRFQTIHRRKDGSHYDTDIILQHIQSGDRPVFAAIIEDITDRKRAEQELIRHRDHLQELVNDATAQLNVKAERLEQALEKEKELNTLQREFVSMASHEFRTPLTIIDGIAQRMRNLANDGRLTPEEADKRVGSIRNAVQRMTRLMESTLSAARMDSGKLEINVAECDLRSVVMEVCVRQLEFNEEHKIVCDLKDLPDFIAGDSTALEQVFTNLLSNAVKYSPDRPDIKVRGWRDGDQAVVSVHDHGIGIDEDDLDRIGERFFRAKSSTGIAGTGIGLNLVKMLVEAHEGEVGIESKKDEGSIFTIRLPIAGPDQSEQAQTKVA